MYFFNGHNRFLSIFFLVLTCTCSPVFSQQIDCTGVKLIDNIHVPQKVVVVLAGGTTRFVKDLFTTIKTINETENLPENERIKLHVIPGSSNSDVANTLGISSTDAAKYLEVDQKFSSYDIWAQDCMELCAGKTSEGKLVPAVFDTNRGRGLAGLPKVLADTWGLAYFKNPSSSQAHGDYGGNLEVVPNEDIMVSGNTITPQCKAFFEKMGYSGRIYNPNTKWLSVGHIDECMSFIPTLQSPGGYSIVKADPSHALDLLETATDDEFENLNSDYKSLLLKVRSTLLARHNNPQAGKGTEEGNFIDLNRKISEINEQNATELKNFIRKVNNAPNKEFQEVAWPCLYEGSNPDNPSGCHAYLPGVVNLTVLRDHLLVPATYFPPFDRTIVARFKAQGNIVHFIDDEAYHDSMGEIHCGTNVLRSLDKQLFTSSDIARADATRRMFNKVHSLNH
ncbi:MAG: hypothetical protein HQM08_08080 [Candidatus Riflebacteria bacterium]|nr:hypothetical protein [Candidatus Riflebacteria bacterium]